MPKLPQGVEYLKVGTAEQATGRCHRRTVVDYRAIMAGASRRSTSSQTARSAPQTIDPIEPR